MASGHPERACFLTVLRLGPATAVLIHDAPAEAAARDALASACLMRATGRSDIAIGRRPSGRPCLAPPHCELGVSLSRRGPVLLAGFCGTAPVGVDVEIDDDAILLDPVRLARDHFARDEAAAIAALPPGDARELFLKLWVAKEAVLKATGRGIVDGLHQPDLAIQVPALLASTAVVAIPGQRQITCAVTRLTVATERAAYCAMAVIEPSGSPQAG